MSEKIVEEIFEELHKRNSKLDSDAIPHSDEFTNHISSNLGIGADLAKSLIKIMINSHMILEFEIVAEDKMREHPAIQGYVECDLMTIKQLNMYYQNELVILYETEFHKRLSVYQVIKAIFPIIKSLNNTPIGKVANKTIMLGEFEKMLEKGLAEYSDQWKEQRLKIELKQANLDGASKVSQKKKEDETAGGTNASHEPGKLNRAIDSKKYADFISRSKSYPLDRIIRIYGVEFFYQISIRKYKFSYLKGIIDRGIISKRNDLLLLKALLQKVKSNIDKDPNLSENDGDVYNLERAITHNLYFKSVRER